MTNRDSESAFAAAAALKAVASIVAEQGVVWPVSGAELARRLNEIAGAITCDGPVADDGWAQTAVHEWQVDLRHALGLDNPQVPNPAPNSPSK